MNPDFRKSMPRTPSTSRNTYGRDSMFSRPSYAPGDIPSTAKRQSVLPPRGGFKDTRPVNDKQYQNDCKGRIGNFLIENNAPGFNEKMLSEPNKSHFSKIFEFLYQKLDPSFNLTSSFKIEHVLPIFAALQYPVQLKTSDIQCLSAPFIWAPKVLPALDWLIELIMLQRKQENEMDVHSIEYDAKGSSKEANGNRFNYWKGLTSQYYTACFKRIYCNEYGRVDKNADFSHEDNRFRQLVNDFEKLDDPRRELQERLDHAKLNMEGLELEEESMRDNLEEKIYDLENNFRQCDEYLETIDKNIEDIKRKYNNAQQEKANIMEKIKEVQLDNESKRRFISTQKMSGEEARARRIERDNLRQHHGDLKARLKEAESRKENIQPDLYKETSKVDDKFKDFVSRLREVAKEVFDNEEQDIVNQVAELDSKNEDFSQNDLGKCRHAINLVATRIDVKFSKLLADCQGARSKCEEACRFISKCNETIDKIGIETARSTTQFQRDFDDIRKDLHQANLEIDCLLQKANLISESIGKLINEGKELLNRNAEIKMKYDQKKRLRENEFQEIVAKLSEKLSIVWDEHIALRNEAMTFSKTAKEMNKAARKIEQMWKKLDSENNTEE